MGEDITSYKQDYNFVYFNAFESNVDIKLKDGASIRLATTADESGIRFTAMINTNELNALSGYGLSVSEFGVLIMLAGVTAAGDSLMNYLFMKMN